ncbi:unnamed protein product [Owenia fusiformis]|uniref:Ig-like domain-containing protein n=1 Tax=Owenia fusiformis TaxID=6347 RepID=A0A8S4PTC8_OWEFU|nr:unnamed protein product [Owenia fusiformis]
MDFKLMILFVTVGYVCAGNIDIAPADTIAKTGEDTELMCQIAEAAIDSEFVSWFEYITDSNGKRVFVSNKPNDIIDPDKYEVDLNKKYNIKIKGVTIGDAGKYGCQTFTDGNNYAAYLTVYDTPSCGNTNGDNVKEGDEVTFECQMNYAGDAKPTLKWYRNQEEMEDVVFTTEENKPAMATVKFTVTPEDNGAALTCRVSSSSEPDFAGDECTSSPVLAVKYMPRNVQATSLDDSQANVLSIGQKIVATADANPVAGFNWEILPAGENKTLITSSGAEVNVTEEMVGESTWTLKVQNDVNTPDDIVVKTYTVTVNSDIVTPEPESTTKGGYVIATTPKSGDGKNGNSSGGFTPLNLSIMALLTSLMLTMRQW